jgi:rhodanese-related sulfurtransferase
MTTTATHCEIEPSALSTMLAHGTALLIDVREPDEFAAGHIKGAINKPLSSFDPADLPPADGKLVVLQCAGGKRSGMALDRCAVAGAAITTHLGGGIAAWKAAGFPTV